MYLQPEGDLGDCLAINSIGEGVRGAILGNNMILDLEMTFEIGSGDNNRAGFAPAPGKCRGGGSGSGNPSSIGSSTRCRADPRRPEVYHTNPMGGRDASLWFPNLSLAHFLLGISAALLGCFACAGILGFASRAAKAAGVEISDVSPFGGGRSRPRRRLYPRRRRGRGSSASGGGGSFSSVPTGDAYPLGCGSGVRDTGCGLDEDSNEESDEFVDDRPSLSPEMQGSIGGRNCEDRGGVDAHSIHTIELGQIKKVSSCLRGEAGRDVFALETPPRMNNPGVGAPGKSCGSSDVSAGAGDGMAGTDSENFIIGHHSTSHPFALSPPRGI